MGKYDSLRQYLSEQANGEVKLDFSAIEKLVGKLPKAARVGESWWTADDSKVQARAWRSAGWHVKSADPLIEQVVFERSAPVQEEGGLKRWITIVVSAAVLTALANVVLALISSTGLPRWIVVSITFDLSFVFTLYISAITDARRTLSLVISNACLMLLILGAIAYSVYPRVSPTMAAKFADDSTPSQKILSYGHAYLVTLKRVYLPPGMLLWVELATPFEEVGSVQRFSYFYTQASPEPDADAEYYTTIEPDNTAKLTTDVLAAFACSISDNRMVGGNANISSRKIDGCTMLDYACITERNSQAKYPKAPFSPKQCNKSKSMGLPLARAFS
jgi:hypothetical protein